MSDESNALSLYDKKNMMVVKRRIPLNHPYLKGETAKKNTGILNQQIFLYKFFETRFPVKHGEVYLASFPFEFGSEIHGDHFVVAVSDSRPLNPFVLVVPLKSQKGKSLNPASDISLGLIEGINNGKQTIAIINQVRTIDKRRLISGDAINALYEKFNHNLLSDYEEIIVQSTRVYRLSNEQYRFVQKSLLGFIASNYLSHEEELLVDF